ncbi:hypothetical protein QQ045_028292 [Rhodiola kirilowii]
MDESPRVKQEDIAMKPSFPKLIQDTCWNADEDDEIPISLLSNALKANCDSSSSTRWKPLETNRKVFKTVKRPLGHSRKIHLPLQEGAQKLEKPKAARIRVRKTNNNEMSKQAKAVKSSVMERAEEVQANLAVDLPSFLKTMQPSHCSTGFFVKLPKNFCDVHLPNHDALLTLVDEHEEQYIVTFLAERLALSGGWRGFCTTNKLLEGDTLVFQLTGPSKFKVYIVRANTLTEVDGAIGLLNLDTKQSWTDYSHQPVKSNDFPCSGTSRSNTSSSVDFKQLKSIDNFTILVNGVSIDSELPIHHKAVYFELCSSQQAFLHDQLLKNIKCKLASEIILETVNIADAINACKLSTPQEEYTSWDRTLEGFETLGMNVAFIRTRLERLASLAFESKEAKESKLYRETSQEKARVDEKIKSLQLRLVELKRVWRRLDTDTEALRANAEKHESRFREEVNAPWLSET